MVGLVNIPVGDSHNLPWTAPQIDYGYLYFNTFESVRPDCNFYRLRGFLEDTIFPIKTSFGNDEPRFHMVSADVQNCTTSTTFDSNPKEKDQNGNCIWYSEHGGDTQNKHSLIMMAPA